MSADALVPAQDVPISFEDWIANRTRAHALEHAERISKVLPVEIVEAPRWSVYRHRLKSHRTRSRVSFGDGVSVSLRAAAADVPDCARYSHILLDLGDRQADPLLPADYAGGQGSHLAVWALEASNDLSRALADLSHDFNTYCEHMERGGAALLFTPPAGVGGQVDTLSHERVCLWVGERVPVDSFFCRGDVLPISGQPVSQAVRPIRVLTNEEFGALLDRVFRLNSRPGQLAASPTSSALDDMLPF